MRRIQIRPLTGAVNLPLNIAALGLKEMEGARRGGEGERWREHIGRERWRERTKREMRSGDERSERGTYRREKREAFLSFFILWFSLLKTENVVGIKYIQKNDC